MCSLVQILGNNECFEPYTSNIYVRRVLSGEFTVVNQHLLSDLTALGLWSADTKNELVAANGSVQVREKLLLDSICILLPDLPLTAEFRRITICALTIYRGSTFPMSSRRSIRQCGNCDSALLWKWLLTEAPSSTSLSLSMFTCLIRTLES